MVEVGHKDGRVIMNVSGTSEVPANYIAWSPDEAREVARQLLVCADAASGAVQAEALN
jgi:hypothetical protein